MSFQSLVNNNQYIRCNNNTVYLENADNSIQFKRDASFFVRQNKYFVWYSAIESAKQPGHFLRHSNEKLVLHVDDGTDKFKKEASYLLAPYGKTALRQMYVLLYLNNTNSSSQKYWKY